MDSRIEPIDLGVPTTMTMSTPATDQLAVQMQAQSAYDDVKKSAGVAYVLWWFLGVFGGHRFYLGHKGVAIGMLLTFGGLGFWAFFDVFVIGSRVRQVNAAKKEQVFAKYGVPLYAA
jgi:TM2 domain-containing membrane protein YozV